MGETSITPELRSFLIQSYESTEPQLAFIPKSEGVEISFLLQEPF